MKTTRHESAEDYLETILVLSKQLPVVRAVDIANELNYKKSSVSVAMKNLRNAEQITVSDAGYITLTEEGKRIAEMIYSRHQFFSKWLISLGIDEELAAEDACSMEHDMSETTFQAIKKFVSEHSNLNLEQ
jgi:DtxR family transcriptional regulator, Mn-dependent transcriptional regulator